jgi:hypothetical protein
MKSSLHRLIPFLPLFCNCQFRRFDSVQFFCSQAPILAGWHLETRLFTEWPQSQSHIATDDQAVSLGIEHLPGAHDQIFSIPRQLRSCFSEALSLSRGWVCLLYMLLALASARVLVPWVLRPYFIVSYLRLPFSSPITSRTVTVDVFDPDSTRGTERPQLNRSL